MLTIELVPKSLWYNNLRSELSKKDWDLIRKQSYKKANYRCEICGGKGSKWPVEAHEIWEYDDKNKVQILKGIIALCPSCHSVKHIGLAEVRGKLKEAVDHLSKINKWTLQKTYSYVEKQFKIWEERNKYVWTLNINYLKGKIL